MFRLMVAFLLTAIMGFAYAQVDEEPNFADIAWLSAPSAVISAMQAEGFTTDESVPSGEVPTISFDGRLLGKDAFAFARFDRTDQLIKLSVYLLTGDVPRASKFSSAERTYDNLKSVLVERYGEPDFHREECIDPYFRGDGYETLAVEEDKAEFTSAWLNASDGGIILEIDNDVDVGIAYESSFWGTFLDNQNAEETDAF